MKYVANSRAELEALVDAWAKAAGFPFPPDGMASATANPIRAAYLAANRAQRAVMAQSMAGWTLRPVDILPEPKGTRFWCEVPDDLAEVVLPAAPAFGRTLTGAEDAALRTSKTRLADDFPADWRGKDDGPARFRVTNEETPK